MNSSTERSVERGAGEVDVERDRLALALALGRAARGRGPTTQRSSSWTIPERSAASMKEAAGSSSPFSPVIRSSSS